MATPPPVEGDAAAYARALHYTSLSCLILCPLLIALPPRRADLLSASLATATLLSANHLHRERYGTGIMGRLAGQRTSGADMPTERARELQVAFNAAREQKDGATTQRTLGEKVWYGGEDKNGWREKRDKELKEKFEEGKGIGDVIVDQVWEVWNQGKVDKEE